MFRRLLVIAALALLAASCSFSDVLATVNGVEITEDDLLSVDPDWEDPANYPLPAPRLDATGAEIAAPETRGSALRQSVFELVQFAAIQQTAEEQFGIVIDDAAVQERMSDPPLRWAGVLDPALMADGANDEVRRLIAEETLIADAVVPEVLAAAEGGYDAWLENRPETVTKVCLRFLITASAEEGEAAIERINAGEDFGDVADDVSLDQSSPGGFLLNPAGECSAALSELNDVATNAIAGVDEGVPVGPIDVGGGFAVLMIDELLLPASAAELEAAPLDYLDPGQVRILFSAWSSRAVREADVWVSPTLGTWSPDALGIIPPGG
ncbi:MAG: hypothetical protein QNJ75_07170 [Acidimicrobiia bacterium]|nr:hypothetical protein [Acidimicrobiia bacterium]